MTTGAITLEYLVADTAALPVAEAPRFKPVVRKAPDGTTSVYGSSPLEAKFATHFEKLMTLQTSPSLWPEGAEAPSDLATALAKVVLQQLEADRLEPSRVVASAEGGVAICFVHGNKYSDIECLNTGAILSVWSNRRDKPIVSQIEPLPSGIAWVSGRIRNFLNPHASGENEPRW